MEVLVIYDSLHGNTEALAQAIAGEIGAKTRLLRVSEAKLADLIEPACLIFGTPTHGGLPKPEFQRFLETIPDAALMGKQVTVFDTRFLASSQNFFLKILMSIIGYAAPKALRVLEKKGAKRIDDPQGFIVTSTSGPLADGELDRARQWVRQIFSDRLA